MDNEARGEMRVRVDRGRRRARLREDDVAMVQFTLLGDDWLDKQSRYESRWSSKRCEVKRARAKIIASFSTTSDYLIVCAASASTAARTSKGVYQSACSSSLVTIDSPVSPFSFQVFPSFPRGSNPTDSLSPRSTPRLARVPLPAVLIHYRPGPDPRERERERLLGDTKLPGPRPEIIRALWSTSRTTQMRASTSGSVLVKVRVEREQAPSQWTREDAEPREQQTRRRRQRKKTTMKTTMRIPRVNTSRHGNGMSVLLSCYGDVLTRAKHDYLNFRNRTALSCQECKRRKIKCDRTSPCSACCRRGEEKTCRWEVVQKATVPYVQCSLVPDAYRPLTDMSIAI